MTGAFVETNYGFVNASQGITPGFPDMPWKSFAGEPTPLSGDTDLVREVNAIYADYVRRTEYLADAERAPRDSQEGLEALHRAYLAEVERSSQAGEASAVASDLRAKRDEGERVHRGTAWQAAIDGARLAVEQARDRYVSFFELHYAELHAERVPEAVKITSAYAKAHEELEAKLRPLRERWATLLEDSRKTVGYLVGFVPDDLPTSGDYTKTPLPTAESLERYGALTSPAPAIEHAELAELATT
jgi:hypothetical protein